MRYTCLFLLIPVIVLAGCRNNESQSISAESGHAHGAGSVAYTAFSDSCEYFAEIKPIIKGQPAEASIHITRLRDYQPIAEGIMGIRVFQNGILLASGDTNKPRIPGIFPVKFIVSKSGVVSLKFVFKGRDLNDSVLISNARVFETEEEMKQVPAVEEPSGVIKFTKEMAWKINFNVLKVIPQDYFNTIRVSGEFVIPPSEITTLSAKGDGIVIYRQANLIQGKQIEKGSVLFTLTGQGLTSRNMDATISGLKSRFEASKSAYEREKTLLKDQIVSLKQFNETISRYKIDSSQYFAFLNGLSGKNMDITASSNGSVIQLFQLNGAYVTEGTPLIAIANSRTIMLRADLPQRNWKDIPTIKSGSFRPSGSDQLYNIEDLNGRLIAKGTTLSSDNQFIPVTFEFPNKGSFIAGSFAEVFLHTTPMKNQLVIPVSSLLEEQGNYYVYVQVAGESFIKRTIKPGFIDGTYTNVVSGLVPGDRVVTRGAIFIKASSQMTGTPSHGHEH
ncbi:MAG: efflux RND transporter periplasmic adaptor subunit [Bacteroidota bacterium]